MSARPAVILDAVTLAGRLERADEGAEDPRDVLHKGSCVPGNIDPVSGRDLPRSVWESGDRGRGTMKLAVEACLGCPILVECADLAAGSRWHGLIIAGWRATSTVTGGVFPPWSPHAWMNPPTRLKEPQGWWDGTQGVVSGLG